MPGMGTHTQWQAGDAVPNKVGEALKQPPQTDVLQVFRRSLDTCKNKPRKRTGLGENSMFRNQ